MTAIPPPLPHDPSKQPAFSWRGLLIDSAHTFWPVPTMELFLSLMARYRFNVLHWRLTDDQGWRMPVPGFPHPTTRLLLRFEHPTPRLLRRRPRNPHRSRALHPFRGRGRYPFVSAPGKPPPRSLRRYAQPHLPMAERILLELRRGSVASRVRSLPLTLHTHRRRAVRLGRVGGRLRPHACGVSSRQ